MTKALTGGGGFFSWWVGLRLRDEHVYVLPDVGAIFVGALSMGYLITIVGLAGIGLVIAILLLGPFVLMQVLVVRQQGTACYHCLLFIPIGRTTVPAAAQFQYEDDWDEGIVGVEFESEGLPDDGRLCLGTRYSAQGLHHAIRASLEEFKDVPAPDALQWPRN